eukprot:Platyproteum_vivax@DN15057_c0_g1_i1.p1
MGIFMFFSISQAHVNPGVTFAVYLRGGVDTADFFLYMIFQVLGAFIGAAIAYGCSGTPGLLHRGAWGHKYNHYHPYGRVFLAELWITIILTQAYLQLTTVRDEATRLIPLPIGFVLGAGGICVKHISGACFNPAAAIGINLIHGMARHWVDGILLVIYVLTPFLAAILS